MKKRVVVSIGDINGISPIIALLCHDEIRQISNPIYVAHKSVLQNALRLIRPICDANKYNFLKNSLEDMEFDPIASPAPTIMPKKVSKKSGAYSFDSFLKGVEIARQKDIAGIITLPINKYAWKKAGIKYAGHTHALNDIFQNDLKDSIYHKAIMMLGCEEMFVALFTEHIAFKDVARQIGVKSFYKFLLAFHKAIGIKNGEKICVLGLNPHCGDGGMMGNEEKKLNKSIYLANQFLKNDVFTFTIPGDSAFTPINRSKFRYFIALSHDVGLAPLKALYFSQSINTSLNLPILRTSPDHGVAYDIAYDSIDIDVTSYKNAVKYILNRFENTYCL